MFSKSPSNLLPRHINSQILTALFFVSENSSSLCLSVRPHLRTPASHVHSPGPPGSAPPWCPSPSGSYSGPRHPSSGPEQPRLPGKPAYGSEPLVFLLGLRSLTGHGLKSRAGLWPQPCPSSHPHILVTASLPGCHGFTHAPAVVQRMTEKGSLPLGCDLERLIVQCAQGRWPGVTICPEPWENGQGPHCPGRDREETNLEG